MERIFEVETACLRIESLQQLTTTDPFAFDSIDRRRIQVLAIAEPEPESELKPCICNSSNSGHTLRDEDRSQGFCS